MAVAMKVESQSSSAGADAPMERVTIPVTGMTCAACQSFVQRTLTGQAGVQDANASLMLSNAAVTFDPVKTSVLALVEAIRSTGYGAGMPAVHQSAVAEQAALDEEQLSEYKLLRGMAAVSLAAGLVAMVLSMPLMTDSADGMERMKDPLMNWSARVLDPILRKVLPWMFRLSGDAIRWFLFVLATFILGWAGRRFYVKAWSALRHKTADMNT